jgi:hypothetical protein
VPNVFARTNPSTAAPPAECERDRFRAESVSPAFRANRSHENHGAGESIVVDALSRVGRAVIARVFPVVTCRAATP